MAQSVLFSEDSLVISYDEASQVIYMDWRGEQNVDTVKKGCNELVKLLAEVASHKILNDNTHVRGSWSEASDWVAKDCLPNLEKAGIRFIAWVKSPSVYSQLSTDKALSLNKSVIVVTFQEFEAAEKWLMSM